MTDNYQENISAFFPILDILKNLFFLKKKKQTELVLFEKGYG